MEKWPFLDQNHGLTSLEKMAILFFCSRILSRRFFVLEYRKRHFLGPYCLKNKLVKMAVFEPKPRVNPLGKMSIFRLFELLVFPA